MGSVPLVDLISIGGRGAPCGSWWTPRRVSHHIETVAGEVLWVVCSPVREASSQLSIAGAVVKLQQPGGCLGVAMLGVEHGNQGSDHTLAGGGGHRSVSVVDLISIAWGRAPLWVPVGAQGVGS